MAHYEKKVDGEVVFQGKIIHVRHDYVELENGKVKLREVVVHPGAVVMLAVHEGYTYMVRQYRYCIGQELLEVPAGKLEKGEDHRDAAIRELKEETGATAGRLEYLGEVFPTPVCTPRSSICTLPISWTLVKHAPTRMSSCR